MYLIQPCMIIWLDVRAEFSGGHCDYHRLQCDPWYWNGRGEEQPCGHIWYLTRLIMVSLMSGNIVMNRRACEQWHSFGYGWLEMVLVQRCLFLIDSKSEAMEKRAILHHAIFQHHIEICFVWFRLFIYWGWLSWNLSLRQGIWRNYCSWPEKRENRGNGNDIKGVI